MSALTAHVVHVVLVHSGARQQPPLDDLDRMVLVVVSQPLALHTGAHFQGQLHLGCLGG